MKIHQSILIFFALCLTNTLRSQTGKEISLQKVSEAAFNYNAENQKQKVFLQPDKDIYFANDKIWFKAFVLSGMPLLTDTLSNNLYVEIWSPSKIRVDILRLKVENGEACGSIFLSDTLEQGVYQLRAFTDRMINYPSEFYFNFNFKFYNSNHAYIISPKEAKHNRQKLKAIEKQKKEFTMYLFPEGGNLIQNRDTKLYFKTTNSFGERTSVNFKLINTSNDSVILTVGSKTGVGEFIFTPRKNVKYKIEASLGNGKLKTLKLPEAIPNGIWGRISETHKDIQLQLSKTQISSDDPSANRYFLLVHQNNTIFRALAVDLRNDTILLFSKAQLPDGIINFSLFSNRLINVANFRSFILPAAPEPDVVQIDDLGDSLHIKIENQLLVNFPEATLSIVVSDTNNLCLPKILDEIYLGSDLSGWYFSEQIESDNFYNCLVNAMPNSAPDWNIVFDTRKRITNDPENGIVVAGKITTDIFSIPVKNASVRLEVLSNYNDVYETVTDDNGNFIFDGFDFYDTLQMKIIARKQTGRKGVVIDLRNDPIPAISEYNGGFFLTTQSLRDNKAYRIEMGKIASEEIHKEEREMEAYYSTVMHGRPDNILYGKDLPQNMNVLEALQGRVAGVNVTGNDVIIRGRGTIFGSTDPLVLVDDVPVDVSYLRNIMVLDVDRIEILKGPSAAVYGVRGANGAIAIYTKRGEFMKRGEIDFTLVGYHKPKDFFNAEQNALQDKKHLPRTIFWKSTIRDKKQNLNTIEIKKPELGKYLIITFTGINSKGETINRKMIYKIR